MSRDRFLWALRIVWAIQPIVAGSLLAAAVDGLGRPLAITITVGLWMAWALALGAMLIPLPMTLVVSRVIAACGPFVALWAVIAASSHSRTIWAVVGGVGGLCFSAVLAFGAQVGDRFVDGASYGDERRMLLRPSLAVLLGPVELAGTVAVAGLASGPLLLAAGRWWLGGVALVIGVPLSLLAFRALYGLVQRWVVFVPAGVVLRDQATLVDPTLFRREAIRFIGPALADSTSTDLRAGANGVALELVLVTTTAIPVISPGTPRSAPITPHAVDGVIFAPSLPGAALDEATRRGIEVR